MARASRRTPRRVSFYMLSIRILQTLPLHSQSPHPRLLTQQQQASDEVKLNITTPLGIPWEEDTRRGGTIHLLGE